MNVRRILALLLVSAALAWLGLGEARADDLGEAWSKCSARTEAHCRSAFGAGFTVNDMRCRDVPSGSNPNKGVVQHQCWRNATEGWRTATQYAYDGRCEARSVLTTEFFPKSGSYRCIAGCQTYYFRNADGTSSAITVEQTCKTADDPANCMALGHHWNPYLMICEPPVPECPAGQTMNSRGECAPEACPAGMVLGADGTCSEKQNECPAGNVRAPSGECLPGDGQCAAGEARRANGTCGKDGDGDGIADVDDDDPDNDGKESASGGDTCDAPPACNGGAIDCMQVKIQWRIDCNTRRNRNISGGACNAMPVCAGDKCDAMEYASLIQQWRATCHLEKLANGGLPGGGTGSGSNAMDPVSSEGVLGDDLDPSSVRRGAGGGSWDGPPTDLQLSEAGYGFGRSCPTLPTVSVMGQSLQFDTTVFCDWMRLGGVFVLIMAHLAGLTLVIRSV